VNAVNAAGDENPRTGKAQTTPTVAAILRTAQRREGVLG